jgi:hypothetical protein
MANKTALKMNRWTGAGALFFGAAMVLMALGVFPMDQQALHAPPWIYAAGGFAFSLAGVAVMFKRIPRWSAAFVARTLTALVVVAGWIAVAADPELTHGGVPLLSPGVNLFGIRVVFGIGAVIAAVMAIIGLKQAIKKR